MKNTFGKKRFLTLVIAILLTAVMIFAVMPASAATSTGSDDSPNYIAASSASTSMIELVVGSGSTGSVISLVNLSFTGTGFAVSDLLAIATDSTSGVSFWIDYDDSGTFTTGGDEAVTLQSTPSWSGTTIQLPLTSGDRSELGNTFFVVIKTSAGISDGDVVDVTVTGMTSNLDGAITLAGTNQAQVIADSTAPVLSAATTFDTDADGLLDGIQVNFTEVVGMDTSIISTTGWTITADSGTATISELSWVDSDTCNITFATSDVWSGDTPNVAYATTGTTADLAGHELAAGNVNAADGAKPIITDLDIYDTTGDGKVDQIIVTWSENIDTDNSAVPVAADFGTIILPDGQTANLAGASFTDPAGSSATITISSITGQSTKNTAVGSTAISGDLSTKWVDGASNAPDATEGTAHEGTTDSAAPVIKDFKYEDNDGDGMIDQFVVSYSETVTAASVLGANDLLLTNVGDFTTAAFGATATDLITGPVTSTTVVLGTESTAVDTKENSGNIAISSQNAFSLTDGINANNDLEAQSQATFTDGAAPVLLTGDAATKTSGDGSGNTSTMALKYSEDISSSSSNTASDYTVELSGTSTAIDVSSVANATDTVTLTLDTSDTDQTTGPMEITYAAGTVTDGTNGAVAKADQAITDGAAPIAISATYYDLNGNGKVDAVNVTISEDLTTTTFKVADWSVSTAGTINLAKGGGAVDADLTEVADGIIRWKDADAEINFNGDADTTGGATAPKIDYTQSAGNLQDAATNELANFANLAVSDGAAPILLTGDAATKTSGDGSGNTSTMALKYSEDISSSSSNTASDYTVELSGTSTAIDVSSVANATDTVTLTLDTSDTDQTTGPMEITYAAGTVTDGTNGAVAKADQAITDGALPVVISVYSIDSNSDGNVDAIEIQFSESIDDSDFTPGALADWTVSDDSFSTSDAIGSFSTAVTVIATDAGGDDEYVNLSFTPSDVQGTDVINYRYTNDGGDDITDSTTNVLANISSTAATDGAAPILLSATYKDTDSDGTVDRVDVTYSEDISSSTFGSPDWSFPTNPHTLAVSSGIIATVYVNITVTGAPADDTSLTTTTILYTNNNDNITDGTNAAATGSSATTLSDGAAPALNYAVFDADYNGNEKTYIDVYFTETIDNSTIATTDFSISVSGVSGVTVSAFYNDGNTSLTTLKLSHKLTGAGPTVSVVAAIDGTDGNTVSSPGPITINTYRISLASGWNLVSIPADVDSTDISVVLSSIWANIDMTKNILWYNNTIDDWETYTPASQLGTSGLDYIYGGRAYWINMNSSATLIGNYSTTLHGTNPAPIRELAGHEWNMVGHWATYNQTADITGGLSTLSDVLASSGEMLYKYDTTSGGFVNIYASSTTNMEPGQGYWLYLKTSNSGYYTLGEQG